MSNLGIRLAAVLRIASPENCVEFGATWSSWGDLEQRARELDVTLTRVGIDRGGAFGVVMRNHPDAIAALVAAVVTERAVVAFPAYLPADPLAAEIEARRPGPVVLDAGRGLIAGAGGPSSLAGVAIEMLTSGTTGPPKRVALTTAALTHVLGGAAGEVKLRRGTRIVWAPLAHIGGVWGVLQSLVEGRRVSLMERFDVNGWVDLVHRHQPAVTGLPPAGLRMLLDGDVDASDLASLRAVTTGTAAAPAELIEEFEARFGIPVLATYGATEFAGAIASWTLKDHAEFGVRKRGSVGRPHPGIDVRVHHSGVLEARGAQLGAEWVRTSDLARIDADGFLYIEGRADDVIVRGGFKVSAGTISSTLERHPDVVAAAVVGVRDSRLGEVPIAAVELRVSSSATVVDLDAFLRRRLPAYQVPAAIHVVDRLPRTPSLKVDAVAVRALGQ